jgi:hypothetical protein
MVIPPDPIKWTEYFDFVSLAFLFCSVTILLLIYYRKNHRLHETISKTVADNPKISRIFSIIMTVYVPIYYAQLWLWTGPKLNLPVVFYAMLLLSIVCEMIFVWAPAKGKTDRLHTITSTIVGVMMITVVALILVSGTAVSVIAQVALGGMLFASIVSGTSLFIVKRFRKYTFWIETGFIIVFVVSMILAGHS